MGKSEGTFVGVVGNGEGSLVGSLGIADDGIDTETVGADDGIDTETVGADDGIDTKTVGADDGIDEFTFLSAKLEPIAVGSAVGVIKGDDVALDGKACSRNVIEKVIMIIKDMDRFVHTLQEKQKNIL